MTPLKVTEAEDRLCAMWGRSAHRKDGAGTVTGAGTTGEDRGAWAGSGGYSQVGKGSQVAEGALGEAGDVVAVEGSEAEAQVRSVPVTGGRARHSPGAPGWPGVPRFPWQPQRRQQGTLLRPMASV